MREVATLSVQRHAGLAHHFLAADAFCQLHQLQALSNTPSSVMKRLVTRTATAYPSSGLRTP